MAAMSGFIEGAMRERSRNEKQQAMLVERYEQFERFIYGYLGANANQIRAFRAMKEEIPNKQ